MRRECFSQQSMFKVCLKKGYDEKEIIHTKNSEKNSKSEIMSKMVKMHNTLKLKRNIVHSIKGRDIENSPHKLYDLSSSESCDGDGGGHIGNSNGGRGTRGIADEKEEPW